MQTLFEALRSGDGAALTLAGAVVIAVALALLALLIARLDNGGLFRGSGGGPLRAGGGDAGGDV